MTIIRDIGEGEVELKPIIEGSHEGITRYTKEGKFQGWTPYEQHVAGQFLNDVYQKTTLLEMMWGSGKFSPEEVYKRASKIYEEKYRRLNLSENYLKYYKDKCQQLEI